MKKVAIIIGIIIIYITLTNTKTAASIIPDEAIRMRVIPHSNSEYDQNIKLKVRDQLQYELYNILKDTKGINEARKEINSNLETIDNHINSLLQENNYSLGYKLSFGRNYFPDKEYKGVTYDEGYYESLVVTLGEGKGDNWWCVLFPPLCLLEADESDKKVEYKFFIQELIEKYL